MNRKAIELSKMIGFCLANKQIILKYQSSNNKLEKAPEKLFHMNNDKISAAHTTETVESTENKDAEDK